MKEIVDDLVKFQDFGPQSFKFPIVTKEYFLTFWSFSHLLFVFVFRFYQDTSFISYLNLQITKHSEKLIYCTNYSEINAHTEAIEMH